MAEDYRIQAIYFIRDTNSQYFVQSRDETLNAVDTTGAVDAFATGFLGFIKEKPLDEWVQLVTWRLVLKLPDSEHGLVFPHMTS